MPAMSQVLAMAARLQEAEETINQLKEALEAKTPIRPLDNAMKQDLASMNSSPSQPLTPGEIQCDLSIDSKGEVLSVFL
jgi:hypothetical protein